MHKKLSVLILTAVLAAAMIISTAAAETTMYVYTENGKPLNVRSSERVANNLVGTLDYGAQVTVRFIYNGWAEIVYPWGDARGFRVDYAYVQSRYLVSSKPGSRSGGSSVSPAQSTDANTAAKAFNEMNAEFRSARQVTSYTVTARPSRASGWVNLRWAPTTEAERIATCPQGKQLIVLAETTNWFQVQDPATGMIGFISRKYVSR